MTATISVPSLRAEVSTQAAPIDPRLRLKAEQALFEQRAATAALAGDLDQAAKSILAALDCERRLAGFGPQVLQLIKPRP